MKYKFYLFIFVLFSWFSLAAENLTAQEENTQPGCETAAKPENKPRSLICGRVLDDQDKPVEKIEVEISSAHFEKSSPAFEQIRSTIDKNGYFNPFGRSINGRILCRERKWKLSADR